MEDLIIVGAAGYGRELLQWAKEIGKWNIKGFLDDNLGALEGYECDYSVLGRIVDWQPSENEVFAIAIADPAIKQKVVEMIEGRGGKFVSVIHPDAKVGSFNKIGKGVVLYPDSRIVVNATIGDYVTILDNTTIGHDAVVGSYSTICGGCGINGHVQIGDFVTIGSHVTTAPGMKIGSGAFVGTGSAVVTHIKAGKRVFGNPARKVDL